MLQKSIISSAFILCAASCIAAVSTLPHASQLGVSQVNAAKQGDDVAVSFRLDARSLAPGRNQDALITPALVNGSDTLRFTPITVAGHNNYYLGVRHGSNPWLLKAGNGAVADYSDKAPYQSWMANAAFELLMDVRGCAGCQLTDGTYPGSSLGLANLNLEGMATNRYEGPFYYITPLEEIVKERAAKGEAFVDFKVNEIVIIPDYRSNPVELGKIRATIDDIKSDKDVKITSLAIRGYASPEGSYENNERLAEGRTRALANYVLGLYAFPNSLMSTSWVAEDWDGLKKYVENSTLLNRHAILSIIDSPMSPDEKDAYIRTHYPSDYSFMLQNWYPALRHSDYTVAYEVKSYTDVAEIEAVMKLHPRNLSLREFFILAQTKQPGSKEYEDIFETAVRMFPDDPVANFNGASIALQKGDYELAAERLAKVERAMAEGRVPSELIKEFREKLPKSRAILSH